MGLSGCMNARPGEITYRMYSYYRARIVHVECPISKFQATCKPAEDVKARAKALEAARVSTGCASIPVRMRSANGTSDAVATNINRRHLLRVLCPQLRFTSPASGKWQSRWTPRAASAIAVIERSQPRQRVADQGPRQGGATAMVLSMRVPIKRVGERDPGRRKPICEAGVRVRQRPVMRRARRREAIGRWLLGDQMVTSLRGMAAVSPAKAADHARGHRYHEHLEHGLISILVDVQLEPQLLLQLLLLLRVQMRSFVGIITFVHVVRPIGVVVVVLIINVRFVTITDLHFGRVAVLRGRSWWARWRRRRARWRRRASRGS